MRENFRNWKPPKFDKNGKTKWNWICKHHEKFKLGRYTDIGAFTYINADAGVEIQNLVQIGSHCSIYSVSTIDGKRGKVVIKNGAKIGTHSTIMPGVTVGENALIGAYSFVTGNIPANTLSLGIPAKVVKKL